MSQHNKIPKELDLIVDKILSYGPTKKKKCVRVGRTNVKSWSIPVADIFANENMRLDAMHFDPNVSGTVQELQESGTHLMQLSELARVELRSQFTRIWAEDRDHGLPYFNATDMLSLLALGVPAGGPRYLSLATDTDVNSLVVREGWLLMTCSGTIGRIFYVPKRLDGWAATHDLIRIIPNEPDIAGYLYAWLSSPKAQMQVLSHTHGGQIDHVTDDQVARILVPCVSPEETRRINTAVMKALKMREEAIESLTNSWSLN